MFETASHDLHKIRRFAFANFFSKKSVNELQPVIVEKVDRLIQRLKIESQDCNVVNLNYAMAGLTLDVISQYALGESMHALNDPVYGKEWLSILRKGIQLRPVGRQFPWLINFMLDVSTRPSSRQPSFSCLHNADCEQAPQWILNYLNPNLALWSNYNERCRLRIAKIMNFEDDKTVSHRTVYHEVRDSGILSKKEKDSYRLMGENSIFLGAGTETTSRNLSVALFYLIARKEVGDKLLAELKTILPTKDTKVNLPQLEALPYLVRTLSIRRTFADPCQSAVLNEAMRCAHGVSSRQPRIATEEDLQYKQWTIPRGTPVMESLYLLHTDPEYFPEPLAFWPERCIQNPSLKRHFFPFGGGSMSCLGMK